MMKFGTDRNSEGAERITLLAHLPGRYWDP